MLSSSPKKKSLFNIIPWWVNVLAAIVVYITMKYFIPSLHSETVLGTQIIKAAPWFAPFGALLFLLPATICLYESSHNNHHAAPYSPDELRKLSRNNREEIVEEALHCRGYTTLWIDTQADGSCSDMLMEKQSKTLLVRSYANEISEITQGEVAAMSAAMEKEQATEGVIISTGLFTDEAHDYAQRLAFHLIGPTELAEILEQ